jgi:hypothetical protein
VYCKYIAGILLALVSQDHPLYSWVRILLALVLETYWRHSSQSGSPGDCIRLCIAPIGASSTWPPILEAAFVGYCALGIATPLALQPLGSQEVHDCARQAPSVGAYAFPGGSSILNLSRMCTCVYKHGPRGYMHYI